MRILVTGGAGFIGSNFLLYWSKNYPDDQLVNLDKLTYAGHLENLKSLEGNPNYTFIQGDICDAEIVKQAMAGVDWVVHFAAESHVDRSIKDPMSFVRTNVLGTATLLDAALTAKVKRFHHVSTDEVFGALFLDTPEKFTPETPYDPHSPYSASKAGSDHLVRAYYDTFGLPVTISNCANNYGPYQDPEKFFARLITNLIDGGNIPIYGDGKYVRDWLYVEDHCRGIDLCLRKGTIGQTYLFGAQLEPINNLSVAHKMLTIMNLPETRIEFVKDRPGHDRRYSIDWSKAKQELGWQPQYDFAQQLAKTIDWYQNNQDWWRPLKETAEKLYSSN